jgi:hypothetical protein
MFQSVFQDLIHVARIALLGGRHEAGFARLEVEFLLALRQELEDPVVLDLLVGRQVLLQEDQRVHLPK